MWKEQMTFYEQLSKKPRLCVVEALRAENDGMEQPTATLLCSGHDKEG